MKTAKQQITWSAANHSTFLNGSRNAKTMIGAVRAAISYGNSELMGEGEITIFANGNPVCYYRAGRVNGSQKGKWVKHSIF